MLYNVRSLTTQVTDPSWRNPFDFLFFFFFWARIRQTLPHSQSSFPPWATKKEQSATFSETYFFSGGGNFGPTLLNKEKFSMGLEWPQKKKIGLSANIGTIFTPAATLCTVLTNIPTIPKQPTMANQENRALKHNITFTRLIAWS